jgi:hypothetical protein
MTMRPLTEAALDDLALIAKAPIPRQQINPANANRLSRDTLVETVRLPSPYQTHHGNNIDHLRITTAGTAALAAAGR